VVAAAGRRKRYKDIEVSNHCVVTAFIDSYVVIVVWILLQVSVAVLLVKL
jgi:hypothetical protein